MVTVLADTGVRTPDAGSMLATAVLVLVQVPPVVASVSVVVEPIQTVAVPPMTFGSGLTVSVAVE